MADLALKALLERYEVGDLLSGVVLIVDDEAPNLEVLRSFLEADYTVHAATSGSQALEIASEVRFDVVIADQRMPGMTGVEMLERLRVSHPDAASIILTGYTDTPALISAINQASVFRFLRKPWQPDEVLEAVAQATERVLHERAIRRLVELLSARTDDLTATLGELRTAQQNMLQMERLVTAGRLAAGITHDLRNAMSGLVLIEREVVERNSDAELVETVRIGLTGVRNLLDALETMQQYVRHKRLSMAMESFDPAHVVRDAVTVMRMDLAFRSREVQVDAPIGQLPRLLGDRQKLVQVLVNLLRNATQATTQYQRIGVSVDLTDKGQVRFAVEDEGTGVPEDVRAKLFDAFVSTKGDQGMGMGLYMSRLIVRNHSGQISCADRDGGGSRFEILLPAAPPAYT